MQPGDLVDGRFHLEQRVAAGGMGEIFRAVDRATREIVAIKALNAGEHQDRARFLREAEALSRLVHPSVVRHIAHGFDPGGAPFLAMEWLDGEDLHRRLLRGRLSASDSVVICRSVADALTDAHNRGIVHRDLKPSNIFLVGGDPRRAKLIDFGIAQLAGAATLTKTGHVIGTPGYMAPEQVRGEARITARADVFSLGCVLFECLTGTPPFQGQHPLALLGKILFDPTPRVAERRPEVPRELDELVARMMAKQPEERPEDGAATAQALAETFDVFRASEPTIDLPADQIPRPDRASLELTQDEQRLLAVILIGGPSAAHDAPTIDQGALDPDIPLEALRRVAAGYGGKVEALINGSMIVTFTAPLVATDLAAQVARCALGLRSLLSSRPIALAALRAKVSGERGLGDALEKAAGLLHSSAELHGIAITELLAALLGPEFDIASGPRGLSLRGARPLTDALARPLLGQPAPFCGRERELAMLEGLFEECVEERSARAVLVTAPAGTGKSRLMHELSRSIARRGVDAAIWTARGAPLHAGSALGLLRQALRRACGVRDADPLSVQRERLLESAARHAPPGEQRRVAEFLGELTGVPVPDEGSAALRAARHDAHLMTEQMQRAWLDFLAAASSARPVLIVLEDLHWGDYPTVQFIDAALRDQGQRPWMVLALARPEVHDLFPKLWHARPMQELRLRPLSPKASADLIARVLGDRAGPTIVARVAALAEGNAFYLEELIRTVAEGGAATLPETIIAMAEARLNALRPEVRRALRAASILGEVFWEGAVAHLLGGPERAAAVRSSIVELVDREVIMRRRDSRFAGEEELAFRHALLREGAYAMLTEEDRSLGHRLALDWLEAHGEPVHLALAQHAERGAAPDRAARHYLRAAEEALRAGDANAAIECAGRGLKGAGSSEIRSALLGILCDGHTSRMELPTAVAYAEEALTLATPGSAVWAKAANAKLGALAYSSGSAADLGPLIDLLSSTAPEPEAIGAVSQALYTGAYCVCRKAEIDMARLIFERLRQFIEAAREPDPLARGFFDLFGTIFMPFGEEDPLRGLEHARSAEASFTEVCMWQEAMVARTNAGMNLWMLGAFEEATRTLLSTKGVPGDTTLTFLCRSLPLAQSLTDRGLFPEAHAVAAEMLEVSTSMELTQDAGIARAATADIHRRTGDLEAAEREALAADGLLGDVPLDRIANRAMLAAIRLALGKVTDALADATEAMDRYTATGSGYRAAFARLVHAECLHAAGREEAARTAITTARDRLLENAAKIRSPDYQRSFLNDVPENRRTLELSERWL
jgi:hypothetical protein